MIREIKNKVTQVSAVDPQVITAGTVNGATIDLLSYDAALIVAFVGAIAAAGVVTLKVQEGSLANASDMADVAAADLVGAFAALTASSSQRVGYIGSKRYIRVVATYVSGTSVAVGVGVVLALPHTMATA